MLCFSETDPHEAKSENVTLMDALAFVAVAAESRPIGPIARRAHHWYRRCFFVTMGRYLVIVWFGCRTFLPNRIFQLDSGRQLSCRASGEQSRPGGATGLRAYDKDG